jgi:hypothetical protein
MHRRSIRAIGAVLAIAALSCGTAAPVRTQAPRPDAPTTNTELQRRANFLLKGLAEDGAKIAFAAVEAGSSPEALLIRQVEISGRAKKKITIEQIEIRAFDWANPKEPRYLDMAIAKLAGAADAFDRDVAENFQDLGVDTIVLNAELIYKFDEQENSFEVARLVLDLVEIGELRLRFKLTGVTVADLKDATAKSDAPKPRSKANEGDPVMVMLARLNIASAAVSFRDKSLVQRWIKAEAKKKNMSEQAAKAMILQEAAEERSKAEDDVTREILDATIKFLRNPREIELAANPPAPANIMMAFMTVIGNRSTFKQLMGLSVTAK